MADQSIELRKELKLNWLNKDKLVHFEINKKNEIGKIKWINRDDITCLEPKKLVNIKSNENRESTFNIEMLRNIIIHGNYSQVFDALSRYFEDVDDSKKVQCAIFAPPLSFQDSTLFNFTSEHFLSFCRTQFYKIKKMLKDSGFIIVHTYEPNYSKLKVILDQIFGRPNYIGTIIWKKLEKSKLFFSIKVGSNDYYKHLFDYILLYSKDDNLRKFNKFPPTNELYKNPDNDPRGLWESRPIVASEKSSNEEYTYVFKNGLILTRKFRYARETLERYEEANRIHFTKPKKGKGIPRLKIFFSERMEDYKKKGIGGTTPNSLWLNTGEFGSIQTTFLKLKEHPTLAINKPFRSEKLYKKLLSLTCSENDLLLDCFSQLGTVLKCGSELDLRCLGIDANRHNIERGIIPWLKKCEILKIHHFKLE
jgi:adenine-specific DNA-methyltransferase